jgi:predicted nucleic acid-binding protein
VKLVFDTDVLVDHLRARQPSWAALLESVQRRRVRGYLSVVTVAELHAGQAMRLPRVRIGTSRLVGLFTLVPVSEAIAIRSGSLIREHGSDGLALADAVIAATALFLKAPLVTRNRRHYQRISGLELHQVR